MLRDKQMSSEEAQNRLKYGYLKRQYLSMQRKWKATGRPGPFADGWFSDHTLNYIIGHEDDVLVLKYHILLVQLLLEHPDVDWRYENDPTTREFFETTVKPAALERGWAVRLKGDAKKPPETAETDPATEVPAAAPAPTRKYGWWLVGGVVVLGGLWWVLSDKE